MYQMMAQMKQQIDSAIKDAGSQANGDNGNPLGVSFDFSKPSELLSKLAQLQSSDPEKFKSLMNEIADKLQSAADESGTDSFKSKMLGDLAAKFKSAAETGDLTQLQPPPPPSGSNEGKIAQYLMNSSGSEDDKESLLVQLLKQLGENDSTASNDDSDSNDLVSTIKDLLSKALQQLIQNRTAPESGASDSSADNT